MLLVLATEWRKELSGLQLKVRRQRSALRVHFLQFDFRFIVLVELEHHVGEALEVGIDGAIQGNFRVAQREASTDGIVISQLQFSARIARRRSAQVNQGVEADVHVRLSGPQQWNWLGWRPG